MRRTARGGLRPRVRKALFRRARDALSGARQAAGESFSGKTAPRRGVCRFGRQSVMLCTRTVASCGDAGAVGRSHHGPSPALRPDKGPCFSRFPGLARGARKSGAATAHLYRARVLKRRRAGEKRDAPRRKAAGCRRTLAAYCQTVSVSSVTPVSRTPCASSRMRFAAVSTVSTTFFSAGSSSSAPFARRNT